MDWIKAPHLFQERNVAKHGRVFGFFSRGATPFLTLADRQLANEVFVEKFDCFRDRSTTIFGDENTAAHDLLSLRGDQVRSKSPQLGFIKSF